MSKPQNESGSDGVQSASKEPVNHVYVSDSARQFIIESCVLCGEKHAHGAKDPAVANGERSHRVAHCTDRSGAGYYLELAPDADPPDHWWSWMRSEYGGDIDA